MSDDRVPTSGLAPLVAGRAREYGERSFLEEVATGRVLTFTQLGELTRWRAAELDAAGVPARARVLIDVADPVNFCVEYLGVLAAGRCVVPVNPDAPDAELARTVATIEPAALISDRPGRAAPSACPLSRLRRGSFLPAAAVQPTRAAAPAGPAARCCC